MGGAPSRVERGQGASGEGTRRSAFGVVYYVQVRCRRCGRGVVVACEAVDVLVRQEGPGPGHVRWAGVKARVAGARVDGNEPIKEVRGSG
jgi:hypothetical protein